MPSVSSSRLLGALVSVIAAALLALPALARADQGACTDSWISAGGGSWTDASNWSNGVPTGADDVCIDLDGNYTVTLDTNVAVNSLSLGLPSSVGTQELDIVSPPEAGAGIAITDDSTIGATGSLVLDSPVGALGAYVGGSGATIDDLGSIESQVESASYNNIEPNVTVQSGASLIASSGETDAAGTITNQGEVSASGTLYIDGGSFDNAGGAVFDSGTVKLYGGTWSQDGGSESGNPVTLFDAAFLGNAPGSTGSFDLTGGVTVTGAITADETVTVLSTPGLPATANLQYDVVNDGTLVLDSPDSSDPATLNDGGNPANELTNDATLEASAPSGGDALLASNLENAGTVEVLAGQLTQNSGTTTTNDGDLVLDPTGQFVLSAGTFDEQSDGTLTFGLASASSYGTLAVGSGQTFNLNGGTAAVLEEGYTPPPGTEFDVVTGPYGSGRFATLPPGFVADYSNPGFIGLAVDNVVNKTAPVIAGTAQDGDTLTTSTGTWSAPSALTYTYRWQLCDQSGANCAPIAHAAARAFTLTSADVGHEVTVVVTATDRQGEQAQATAAPVGPTAAPAPPQATTPPQISGILQDGVTLHVGGATWSSPDPLHFSYQWQLCDGSGENCQPAGANSSSFKLTSADVGHEVAVLVTATDKENQSGQAGAGPVGPVAAPAPPSNTVLPVISGPFAAGRTVRTTNGKWTSPDHLSYTYAWEDCDSTGQNCTPIPGASSQTYTLTAADVAGKVTVTVTATDQEDQPGQATATPYPAGTTSE